MGAGGSLFLGGVRFCSIFDTFNRDRFFLGRYEKTLPESQTTGGRHDPLLHVRHLANQQPRQFGQTGRTLQPPEKLHSRHPEHQRSAAQHPGRGTDLQHVAVDRPFPGRAVCHRSRVRLPEHRPERIVPILLRTGRAAAAGHELYRTVDRICPRRGFSRDRCRTAALHRFRALQQDREQLQRHLADQPQQALHEAVYGLPGADGHHTGLSDL